MKKKQNYLIVSADNIIKEKNQNGKIIPDNIVTRIFEKYNIPKRYQKIVLKLQITSIFNPYFANELITNKVFYSNESLIRMHFNPRKHKKIVMNSNDLLLITEEDFKGIVDIKNFYQEIIANNLAKAYEDAIREIFSYENILSNNQHIKKKKLSKQSK